MSSRDEWGWLGRALRSVLDSELRRWGGLRLFDAFIGPRYSYVELDGGWCGIAYSPRETGRVVEELEHATPRYLARLVERGLGGGAASLALAAANAATMAWIYETPDPPILIEARLSDFIELRSDDVVAVIGFMRGVVEELANRANRVYVIELSEELRQEASGISGVEVLSAEDGMKVLPQVSVLVATGSALLYPAIFRQQLAKARNARERVIVGPTSSFHPRLARLLGLTGLGGVYIDPSLCRILRWHIAGGGGIHSFRRRGSKAPLLPRFFARA